MANIFHTGEFIPFDTDKRKLILIKSRCVKNCCMCGNTISTNSFCLGKSGGCWYDRICLNCSETFLNNFIESIEKFKQIGINALKDIKENENKYKEINAVAMI